jgi:hypothetical protein
MVSLLICHGELAEVYGMKSLCTDSATLIALDLNLMCGGNLICL